MWCDPGHARRTSLCLPATQNMDRVFSGCSAVEYQEFLMARSTHATRESKVV